MQQKSWHLLRFFCGLQYCSENHEDVTYLNLVLLRHKLTILAFICYEDRRKNG